MKHHPVAHFFGAVLLAATLLPGSPAIAQDKAAPAPTQAVRDERALTVLKGMSDTLAKAQTLIFKARTRIPFAMPSGQQISLFGTSRVVMQRPDKLFVETRGDLFPHDLYFDGKTVTALAAETRHYAQQAVAANTVEALIETKHTASDTLAPFVDLLVGDPYARLTQDLASALLVGQSTIDGVHTEHLAFTGSGVDWEMWIGSKDKLPRLIIVHYRSGDRQPTFTVALSDWKLGAAIPPRTFSPALPKGAQKVDFKAAGVSPSR
ncbi:MAG: DUF2092 domain-containing protein [Candidatus Accumulibacter sp. UW26]|jgi:hypothetical protein